MIYTALGPFPLLAILDGFISDNLTSVLRKSKFHSQAGSTNLSVRQIFYVNVTFMSGRKTVNFLSLYRSCCDKK